MTWNSCEFYFELSEICQVDKKAKNWWILYITSNKRSGMTFQKELVSSNIWNMKNIFLLKYITNGSEAENPKYHCFDINIKVVNKLFVIFLFRNDIGLRSS